MGPAWLLLIKTSLRFSPSLWIRIQINVYNTIHVATSYPVHCTVLTDYNNQMPVIRSGDGDAIIKLIDGGMSVNSQCPIPYHQPLLSYLILYGRPANPMGAAKAMQYAIENGADLNKGAKNGVGWVEYEKTLSSCILLISVQITGVLWWLAID